ncbi:MAG TPA: hypothetical protein VML91_28160 [Burkholderiales bacterium]|nr:hypothetical protein [Burkholderiales bacterium]HTQ78114.1 hypothetical protein [Burkholderiales bacterium]
MKAPHLLPAALFAAATPAGVAQEAKLPVEGALPTFKGATGWLNSQPLAANDLRGKVVLVP